MIRRSLAALVLVNAVLLAALSVSMLTPAAHAQFGASGGNFLMIAGQARGRSGQNVVYVIDQQTSQVVAMMFNSSSNKIEYIASRRISDDARAGSGSAR